MTFKRVSLQITAVFCAFALMGILLSLVPSRAEAEPPKWAKACAATTQNPWIKSGYCEAHQAWDKYYCKCNFVPDHSLFGFGGFGGGRKSPQDDATDNADLAPPR